MSSVMNACLILSGSSDERRRREEEKWEYSSGSALMSAIHVKSWSRDSIV